MKIIKREKPHFIVGLKAEELDLIGGALKWLRKYTPPTTDTIRAKSMARDLVTDIYKILKDDKYWNKKIK